MKHTWKTVVRLMHVLQKTIFVVVIFMTIGPPARATRPVEPTLICGNGVELYLSSTEAVQGAVLLAEIHAPGFKGTLKGRWKDRDLLFWKATGPDETYRTFLGVDLNQAAESSLFRVTMEPIGAESFVCDSLVFVQKGQFKIQRLQVDPKFVELSEKDLARYRRESTRMRKQLPHSR